MLVLVNGVIVPNLPVRTQVEGLTLSFSTAGAASLMACTLSICPSSDNDRAGELMASDLLCGRPDAACRAEEMSGWRMIGSNSLCWTDMSRMDKILPTAAPVG